MQYQYQGFLKSLLNEPDPTTGSAQPAVVLGSDDLLQWRTIDLETSSEWRGIPVRKKKTEQGVVLEGRFNDVRRIDTLSPEDPRYWVPLSSLGSKSGPFPIDLKEYPIVEITYRCTSENAHPTWMWTYPGGSHFGALPYTQEWTTVARLMRYFDFPDHVTALIFRLYSPTRTVESVEIQSVKFRAMSEQEAEAFEKSDVELRAVAPPKHYPILEQTLPIGVYMDVEVTNRLAETLHISVWDYWMLVMEDLALHHHNTVALSRVDMLEPDEWKSLQDMAVQHGVKFIARHTFYSAAELSDHQRVVDSHIKPFADSPAILAHGYSGEPIEEQFYDILRIRDMIEESDPNRPVSIVSRYPNAYPLFAPFFPASGIGHFATRNPWQLGESVRRHLPLHRGQQFWVAAPTFSYTTETPEWSTGPEMRLMVNLAFANGARGWLAYTYHNDPVWIRGRCQKSLTGPFLTFSDLWSVLGQRMGYYDALAPLFLNAQPGEVPDWFVSTSEAHAKAKLPGGVPPTSAYCLDGDEFSLYFIISNDTHDMTTAHVNIRPDALGAKQAYVISDFVMDRRARQWSPMPLETTTEMFPGQAFIILVGEPDVCEHWRDEVTRRLVEVEGRRLSYDLNLARNHGLDCARVEDTLQSIQVNGPDSLRTIDEAQDALLNTLYAAPVIAEARSGLIQASSALAACDGALCQLLSRGRSDQAHALGDSVLELGRAVTRLRIELRQGEGPHVQAQAHSLVQRAVDTLEEINAALQE